MNRIKETFLGFAALLAIIGVVAITMIADCILTAPASAVEYSLPDKSTISKNPINGVFVQKDLAKTQLHINAVDSEGSRCERMLQQQAITLSRICNPSALAAEEYLAHQQRMAGEWQVLSAERAKDAITRDALNKQAAGLQEWEGRLAERQARLDAQTVEVNAILKDAESLIGGAR